MHTLSFTGLILLYVGVVLWVNGFSLLGRVDRREVVWVNFFVGLVSFLTATSFIFTPAATPLTIRAGAWTYLFSCTYFWVAWNRFHEQTDERGLGWYCLFVALTALPIALTSWSESVTLWGTWFSCCWVLWAFLWFVYFLHLSYGVGSRKNIGLLTLTTSVVSAWIPGYLLLYGFIG